MESTLINDLLKPFFLKCSFDPESIGPDFKIFRFFNRKRCASQKCCVQCSSIFNNSEDALSVFYWHGFDVLKNRFGTQLG